MFVRPSELVEQFGINRGDRIVDCGSGNGTFTLLMAERVGREGEIIALDVQKPLIESVIREAEYRDIMHVTGFVVDIERLHSVPLKDGVADMCLLANVLFQMDDKKTGIRESVRLLKSGGKLIVIEWRDAFGGIGPHPSHIIPEEDVHVLCDEVGLLYETSIDAGSYQYGVIFTKL